MSTITVTFPQLAAAALSMLNTSTITADDQSLAFAAAAKRFLSGIADGSLVVSQPPTTAEPSGGPARGSDGIVPAGGVIPPGAA